MFAVFRFFARVGQDAFAYAHHAEDVFCGALPPGAADVVFFLGVLHRYLVEDFNQDGKTDGGVEIAFGDLEVEGFRNQAEAYHEQEAQTEHDDGGMAVHKIGQGFAGPYHHGHGDDDGSHGDDDVVDHGHGGNDGIDGENGIENQNLGNNAPKKGMLFLRICYGEVVGPFEAFVQFGGGFIEQEESACKHNQVFA